MAGVQDRVLACRPLPVLAGATVLGDRQQLMRRVEDPFVLDKSVTSWASMSSQCREGSTTNLAGFELFVVLRNNHASRPELRGEPVERKITVISWVQPDQACILESGFGPAGFAIYCAIDTIGL